jgi:hypothetical protein
MKRNKSKDGQERPKTRKVIIKPVSKRQVKRFLKKPFAQTSAVVYFTEKDQKPFLLSPEGGGISASGEFKLTKKWKLTKDKLDRIFIIAAEEDALEDEEASEEADD